MQNTSFHFLGAYKNILTISGRWHSWVNFYSGEYEITFFLSVYVSQFSQIAKEKLVSTTFKMRKNTERLTVRIG